MNLFDTPYAGYGTWENADYGKEVSKKVAKAYRGYAPREILIPGRGNTVRKTLAQTLQFDTSYFRICDEDDPAQRLGVWNTDEDLAIRLLRPMTNNRKEVNIQYLDFRGLDGSAVRGGTDWCVLPTFPARDKITACTLRYCFDFNTHYSAVRERLTPNDFAAMCYRDVIYDMDGNQITNEADYQQFLMMVDMRESMYREIWTGTLTVNSYAKGIKAWFNDFATDHTELTGNCTWLAPSIVAASQACAELGATLENRIKALREYTRDVKVQGTGMTMSVGPQDFVLVVGEKTAECLIKCHVCQDVCGVPLIHQATNPAQLLEWKQLYPSYLTGGRFGQGFFVTPNGMTIDIVRSRRVAEGEAFFLYTGNASDPDGGLRLMMNDYSQYVNYMRADGLTIDNENPTLYGGTVVMLQSADLCGDRYARWGWSLFDKRPFMQTYYTTIDIAACTVPAVVTLPDPFLTVTGRALNCP